MIFAVGITVRLTVGSGHLCASNTSLIYAHLLVGFCVSVSVLRRSTTFPWAPYILAGDMDIRNDQQYVIPRDASGTYMYGSLYSYREVIFNLGFINDRIIIIQVFM